MKKLMYVAALALCTVACSAQETTDTATLAPLPKVTFKESTAPLGKALQERRTTRAFSDEKLDMQTISNLLWAAWGVNRDDGKRTAPSAMNRQEVELYVVVDSGVFLFDAQSHALKQVSKANITKECGAGAPLTLVYVADLDKQKSRETAAVDIGFIGQNVHLFCAAENLGTVFIGRPHAKFTEVAGLKGKQTPFYMQRIGKPKK